jgi:hypothetical protein
MSRRRRRRPRPKRIHSIAPSTCLVVVLDAEQTVVRAIKPMQMAGQPQGLVLQGSKPRSAISQTSGKSRNLGQHKCPSLRQVSSAEALSVTAHRLLARAPARTCSQPLVRVPMQRLNRQLPYPRRSRAGRQAGWPAWTCRRVNLATQRRRDIVRA